MTKSTITDLQNLLLGLAWLGELDRTQIARLWFPDKSESTVEKTITRLQKDGLISARKWSVRDAERNVTVPQLARWSLTAAGHAVVASSDQYPPKPQRPRQSRLMAHDARTTETIVRLIEIGRCAQLSGVFIAHEVRLDPHRSRPICDALVVLQFGTFRHANLVPWSNDPAIEDEARVRFAIEADNDTEPAAVIRGKAVAYATLHADPDWRQWWYAQYGPLPTPLWVVPTPARTQVIQQQWQRAWPMGDWIITDDAGLVGNHWVRWWQGREQRIRVDFTPPPATPVAVPVERSAHSAAPSTDTAPRPTDQLAAQHVAPIDTPIDRAPAASTDTTTYATARPDNVAAQSPTAPVSHARQVVPVAQVELPTAVEYRLAARQQRTAWTWCWTVVRGIWWLLRACVWLWASPIWLGHSGWAWYQRQGETTQYLLARLLLVTLLAGVLGWAIITHPQWRQGGPPSNDAVAVWVTDVYPVPTAAAASPPLQPMCGGAHITAPGVKLRRSPGVTVPVIRTLQRNEHLTLWCDRAQADDAYTWLHVRTGDGVDGWAASQWIQRE